MSSLVAASSFGAQRPRLLHPPSLLPADANEQRITTRTTSSIQHGPPTSLLDLSALNSLVSKSQTRAIEYVLRAGEQWGAQPVEVGQWADRVERIIREEGLDGLVALSDSRVDGFLARPRTIDVVQAVNRLRSARFELSCLRP